MNLAACQSAEVFTAQTACGIRVVQRPKITFGGSAREGEGFLGFGGDDGLEVFVDDEPRGVISNGSFSFASEALLTG